MKKFIVASVMAVGLALGFGGVASAYPPDDPTVTVSVQSPVAGSSVTVTFNGCPPTDPSATFALGAASATSPVVNGVATATLAVPTTPGTATGTVACASGISATFEVLVVAPTTPTPPTLPATGGSGLTQSLQIALALLAIGGGLLGVQQIRRRHTVDA